MGTNNSRRRAAALATAFIAAVGIAAVVIPALAAPSPSAVRLHLGSDGQYFAYGTQQQPITTSGCKINSPEPIIDLSAGSKYPGLASNGIGVKGSSSTGTSCGQVESGESLKLARGANLGGRKFTGVRLDLEMTKSAVVKLTLASSTRTEIYQLQTGRSIQSSQSGEAGYDSTVPYLVSSGPGDQVDACAAPNSSGPNSGPNDNCLWTVIPGFDFDTITLTVGSNLPSSDGDCYKGTVALEGGGDFGNSPDYETLLYLANTAPTANNDTYSTNEDVSVQGNVLTNDTDADGNPLTASVVTGPGHGSLSLTPATGAFTYTPDPDWFGIDSFTYAASDGTASSNATATITVASVNDPPVAASGTATTDEDSTVTITVATDVDSTDLSADCDSSGGGTLDDNGDGTVDFTPPANVNGPITITCTVTDDQGGTTSPEAEIELSVDAVNDAPIAVNDSAEANAGGFVVIDVLGNDTDVDGDVLEVADIADVSPSGATALVNVDGDVVYTPPAGYDGPGSFTYAAYDGEASSNVATVDITVFPVLCTGDTVSDTDGEVIGAFTRLTDSFDCKRYALDAVNGDGEGDTILFQPSGTALEIGYRGVVSFGPDVSPPPGANPLRLSYDPTGNFSFQPMQWCMSPQFDHENILETADGLPLFAAVTAAELPAGETWCIASAYTQGDEEGNLLTYWQVYGLDDPRMTR